MIKSQVHIEELYKSYHHEIVQLPHILQGEGVTLHSGRNIIKKITLSIQNLPSLDVTIKSFSLPLWPQGLIYTYGRPSKAVRCMDHARKLLDLKVPTPDPIAFLEYRKFECLRQSYYICRYHPHDFNLASLLQGGVSHGPKTEDLFNDFVQFTFQLHEKGVFHLDYNPGNILVTEKEGSFEFSIVDINRLCFQTMDMNDRISCLVRVTSIVDFIRIIGEKYAKIYGVNEKDFCHKLEKSFFQFKSQRRRLQKIKSWFRSGYEIS